MSNPCYIYNYKKIDTSTDIICSTFGSKFEHFVLAYSFKTNSYPAILDSVREKGLCAEVVSPEEYVLALGTGFLPENIIYNGVCKDKEQIVHCATKGGKVNLDNREDLEVCLDYFKKHGKPLSVGLRLAFDIDNGITSRFGINVKGMLYREIVEHARQGRIIIKGLSCHFTNAKEAKYWAGRAKGICGSAMEFDEINPLEYLDFGGNLAGSWEASKNEDDNGSRLDFESVADSLYRRLQIFGLTDKTIIIESGTAVAGGAFDLRANVLHVKENGFIVLDVSFMDMLLPSLGDSVSFDVIHGEGECQAVSNYTITGYTCLENDIIKKGFNGKIASGDQIIFRNVGAYSYCFANNFIKGPLPVIQK